MGKKVLVTGGSGFIGSNVAHALAASGEVVVLADSFGSTDKWKNIQDIQLDDIILPKDLSAYLEKNIGEIGAIVHMGAVSSTTERDVDFIIESNIRLTLDLWDLCSKHGVRLIYASSAATYGDGGQGFEDHEDADYLMRLRPLNPYGWSKLATDRAILARVQRGEATPPQWAGLRFFNVYGAREDHKGDMRSVVRKVYPTILAGQKISLFKSHNPKYRDGGQLRDFVSVEDCAAIILWMLKSPNVTGIFNIGTGQPRTFEDLALAAYAALGRQPHIEFTDMPEQLRDRYQYYTCANIGKLRAAGYNQSFLSLEEGVKRYIAQLQAAGDLLE
ncbi:MAG TPA: ADP-glyceromanno-heptose 6-epimerase [Rhizomicrobium sp.]|jgi:ADP-L-glycero-D-manno-heptose 6-epimerase|nr:ADP-glyceromanno-heptose 6-epimerase [Rhizomicrobium sp.]